MEVACTSIGGLYYLLHTFPQTQNVHILTLCVLITPPDLEWVLKYGYAVCFPPDQAPAVEKRMRSTFVPFAMSNPGLLTLILYVAYHRRAMNTTDVDEAIKCNRMVERYRMACIEWTRHAVSVEKRPTLETVAMALTMSSEAVSLFFPSTCRRPLLGIATANHFPFFFLGQL